MENPRLITAVDIKGRAGPIAKSPVPGLAPCPPCRIPGSCPVAHRVAKGIWGKMMLLEQLLLKQRVEHRMVLTDLLGCPHVSPVALGGWAGSSLQPGHLHVTPWCASPPSKRGLMLNWNAAPSTWRHLGIREGGKKEVGEVVGPWWQRTVWWVLVQVLVWCVALCCGWF